MEIGRNKKPDLLFFTVEHGNNSYIFPTFYYVFLYSLLRTGKSVLEYGDLCHCTLEAERLKGLRGYEVVILHNGWS